MLQIRQLPVAFAEFIGDRQPCSLCFHFDDIGPLRLQLCGDLFVDGLASFRDFFAGLLEQRFAPAKVRFLGGKLLVELAARLRNQGRRERFCQLDFSAAARADDLGIGHGIGPRMIVRDSTGRGCAV
ncbi:hypothetical protein AB7M16_004732 [Bradyrhizobium sp. USDA 372]